MAARKKKRELSEKAQKRIRQRNLHVGITVIAAIVIIFSVIQFTLWRYVSKVDEEYICKNVFIGKTDVSGMTKEEAVKAVDNTLGDYRNKQLVLKVKDQGADVSIEEMGAEVENIDKLAEKAVGYGKNGSIWSRYQKIHNLDKKKYVIDESFKVDEAKLRELIQERAVPLEQKAINASASYNGSGFDLTDEAEGYTVDVDKSVKKIKNFMNKKWNYEDAEVELKLDTEEPTIKKTDLESLQDELGSYTTNAGWGDRVQNIRRATELINGTVVMPGEEFEDYKDYLRVNGHRQWEMDSVEMSAMRELGKTHNDSEFFMNLARTRPPQTIANMVIVLIMQTDYLLFKQLQALSEKFLEEGGFSERMARMRLQRRNLLDPKKRD